MHSMRSARLLRCAKLRTGRSGGRAREPTGSIPHFKLSDFYCMNNLSLSLFWLRKPRCIIQETNSSFSLCYNPRRPPFVPAFCLFRPPPLSFLLFFHEIFTNLKKREYLSSLPR